MMWFLYIGLGLVAIAGIGFIWLAFTEPVAEEDDLPRDDADYYWQDEIIPPRHEDDLAKQRQKRKGRK